MKMGLYVHIPFCLQKCTYCDFATTAWSSTDEAEAYMALLLQELRWAKQHFPQRPLKTIYFGGGTPSLIPPPAIVNFVRELEQEGISLQFLNEVTLEINPGTVDADIIEELQSGGINRFSVGAQTFQQHLMQPLGREHSVSDTIETLSLLKSYNVNFTMDVLYGLPDQSLADLKADVDVVKSFGPPHVSTYNLTVPEKHPLNKGRLSDEAQVDMYFLILEELKEQALYPYEISNLARAGHESEHNRIYWQDEAYWALGMSGHSYLPERGPWGTRFSNPSNLSMYTRWVKDLASKSFEEAYAGSRREDLTKEQSVIDYVHTSLRQTEGVLSVKFLTKFGEESAKRLQPGLVELASDGLLEFDPSGYRLTPRGRLLQNSVLRHLFAQG